MTIKKTPFLSIVSINTSLGQMVVIADSQKLHLLEFFDRKDLSWEIERLRKRSGLEIIPAYSPPIYAIEKELEGYFSGNLKNFTTPFCVEGTLFQQQVWQALQVIPYGHAWAYAELAATIGRPTAFRAVALANASNQLALVIPCHRVINTGGKLGGYGAGLERKKWLLDHEQKIAKIS